MSAETKTWRDVLEKLPGKEKPTRLFGNIQTALFGDNIGDWMYLGPRGYHQKIHKDDAHNAIRVAAEDRVRGWCASRKSRMGICDYREGIVGIEEITGRVGTMIGFSCIGFGPDLATAIWQALDYIERNP